MNETEIGNACPGRWVAVEVDGVQRIVHDEHEAGAYASFDMRVTGMAGVKLAGGQFAICRHCGVVYWEGE